MNYRVNWQAGMRLTDDTFRAADEYHITQLYPLYALIAKSGYGFLESPIVRYVVSESAVSFIEIQADAVCYSGKLIGLHFSREERLMFQNIPFPETTSPVIAFLDLSSAKTISLADSEQGVPLCDYDYRIILKMESEHYNNPDAVPFVRFVYKHGWEQDTSFIAPCILLRANGALLRSASLYVSVVDELISELKKGIDTAQSSIVLALIPCLSGIAVEVEKEAEAMSTLRFISLMQQGIQEVVALAELYEGLLIPEHSQCKEYVDSHYSPYSTSFMVEEGIRLTKALVDLPRSFQEICVEPPVSPQPQYVVPHRPHGDETRGRIKRQGGGFRR